jgi:D-glycero-alpha-D-manno-heptose-7-phosphate kinase
MLITRTPLRISLVGGGTDMPAFYTKYKGAVVSFAINKYIYVAVNKKFDGKFRISYSQTENVDTIEEIKHDLIRESLIAHNIKTGLEIVTVSDIPGNGTGLGSSSALTVGLVNALEHNAPSSTLAERAWTIEAEKCFHPVGKQDHYASAHGGLNYFEFSKRCVTISPIPYSENWVNKLESHSLLLWTGISRNANDILKKQRKNFEGDEMAIECGKELACLASNLYKEILDTDFIGGISMERLAEFLDHGWALKQGLEEGIGSGEITDLYDAAIDNGAWGGKLLGAGGGGFLYFIAPPDTHKRIAERTGLRRVDFKFEPKGSEVVYET